MQQLERLVADKARMGEKIRVLTNQRDELVNALEEMRHDLEILYGKYREPNNRHYNRLKAAVVAAKPSSPFAGMRL